MSNDSLDLRDRDAMFRSLQESTFDLLVIGAGITGCGVARDAAMRGLSVAVVDGNDIAAGTSSRSSKLVHGGMRYLAQGQVSIVREAATERTNLRNIAPHLAVTTMMVIPAPSRTGLLKLKTAVLTFEKLGSVVAAERHEMWGPGRLAKEEPHLRCEGLAGALSYPEYVTDDARLTVANARSAAASGAVFATYAPVERLQIENDKIRGVVVGDALTDQRDVAQIRARVVINAAGPWLDALMKLEDPTASARLQLTKGIHVVLPLDRLPLTRTIIIGLNDKRSIFAVPRGQYVYLGTTDTFYADAEYWPSITRQDVDYLLEPTSKAFNTGPFGYDDIVSLWSGVRPLLAQAGKSPSEISRRNEIITGPHGMLSIAGGKLTSYRSMAKRIVDRCESLLGKKKTPCTTADEPLPGGDITGGLERIESDLRDSGIAAHEAGRIARLYGGEAATLVGENFGPAQEAEFAVLHEGAAQLEDYWIRRSARAHFDTQGGIGALEPASVAMGALLGWSDEQRSAQVAQCITRREGEMAVVSESEGVERVNR